MTSPLESARALRPHVVASIPSLRAVQRESYLVIGGSGFLGRTLVDALLLRGVLNVRVLDLNQTYENDRVEFMIGDVRNVDHVKAACVGIDTVFHVASLTVPLMRWEDYHAVNVKGTDHVVEACLACGVSKLIYTSTGSVVFDGNDIKGGDENMEIPKRHLDPYSASKAMAERIVIEANGKKNVNRRSLLTTAIRPHAMFGPRDTHFIAQLIAKAREGDITHFVGDGQNLCDFTFVGNAVHAHLLAADRLALPNLPPAGNCYFITNGEPRPFWAFIGDVLSEMGCVGPTKSISFRIAYAFACVVEFLHWLLSPFVNTRPSVTRHMVCVMACNLWFSHAKATRDLGYRPIVRLEDGLALTIEYFQNAVKRRMDRPVED